MGPTPTDRDLILAAQAGDTAARDAFLARHEGMFHSIVYKVTRNPERFDDLLQAARTGACVAVTRWDASRCAPEDKGTSYVFEYARGYVRDTLTKMLKDRPEGSGGEEEGDEEVPRKRKRPDDIPDEQGLDPEQALLAAEERRQVREAMAKLPELERWVLERTVIEGAPTRELVKRGEKELGLRKSAETWRRIEVRATERLRKLFFTQ